MRLVCCFATAFLTLSLAPALGADTAVDHAKRDEIMAVPKGDPDMEAAFHKARETLTDFLALARAPRPSIDNMAVKVAIRDRNETEYFWVGPFKEKDGAFVGTINNTPRSVHNVKLGQVISFQSSDIVDWLYRENGRMVGNYTACVLLKQVPASERQAFAREYGLNCEGI
jgi:uncharacterized protein YegJ (DUF2314 family)